jgi:hypothetical protein
MFEFFSENFPSYLTFLKVSQYVSTDFVFQAIATQWAHSWEISGGPVPHASMGPMASLEMSAANTILLVRIPKQGMEEIVTN